MKKTVYLNESDEYGPNSRCRREEVFGRLELLKAFFDDPPFWMIRLRSFSAKDREILAQEINSKWGNGHWRFVDEESAKAKFLQLCSIPEYVKDAKNRLELRERQRERVRKLQSDGKFKPFPRTAQK